MPLSDDETVADTGRGKAHAGPRRIASYAILRELGAGGMGTVFEAFDEAMGRRVALKVMSRHMGSSERAEQRFEQESWIAGKLTHPNLVKVHERGSWEELSYYSMELVEGGSLADVISNMRRWGRDDGLGLEYKSPGYVRWAVTQLVVAARALDHAHRQGVVHRDVKPMNLLFDRVLGTIKVADFGLAIDSETTRMTTAGKMLGTLSYMAPEQILGRSHEIGPRTDVYALGVTLFELLTLTLPYEGASHQLYANAVLTQEARKAGRINRLVGRDLEIVLSKALEKDARDRYESAAALADDLESVLNLHPIRAVPPRRIERCWKWARRKPMHAALIATLAVALPLTIGLGLRALESRRLVREVRLEELRERAILLDHRYRWDELVEVTSEMLAIAPGDVRARRMRSVAAMYVALDRRATDPAAALAAEGLALGDAEHLAAELTAERWPLELQAFVLSTLGHVERAQRVQSLAEDRGTGERSEQDLHLGALNALAQGEAERAVKLLDEALARRPSQRGALEDRARALAELGRDQEALQDYRLALALDPDNARTRLNVGVMLTRTGEPEEAARHLEYARGLGPLTHEAFSDNLLGRGRNAYAAGEADRARALFVEAEREARDGLALAPASPWLHVNLAASLMEQYRLGQTSGARLSTAIEHYTRALELWKGSVTPDAEQGRGKVSTNLCDALIQSRRVVEALEVCADVATRFPERASAHYNLAGALALAGRDDEALVALERDFALGDRDWAYLEADPWFEALRADGRFRALVERMRDEAPAG